MGKDKYPKDVSPQFIVRDREISAEREHVVLLSLRGAQRELTERVRRYEQHLDQVRQFYAAIWKNRFSTLDMEIAEDPVAAEIRRIAENPKQAFDEVAKKDILLSLKMFVYLFHEADPLVTLLKRTPKVERPGILNYFDETVSGLFEARQVVEPGWYAIWVDHPDQPPLLLKQGLVSLKEVWARCLTLEEKKRAIKEILDSPKGYEKTLRTVDGWNPPRLTDLNTLLTNWRDAPTNDSVFTGRPQAGQPKSANDQINFGYNVAPPEEKQYLWTLIFFKIGEALGISGDRSALKAVLGTRADQIHAALDPVFGLREVTSRLNSFRVVESKAPEAPPAPAERVLKLKAEGFNQFEQFKDFLVYAQLRKAMAPVRAANPQEDPKPRTDAEMAQILGKFGSEFTRIKDHARYKFIRVSNAEFEFDLAA